MNARGCVPIKLYLKKLGQLLLSLIRGHPSVPITLDHHKLLELSLEHLSTVPSSLESRSGDYCAERQVLKNSNRRRATFAGG